MDNWHVEVVEDASGKVVKRMGPMPKRKAERVDTGVRINLDHDRFSTRVVQDDQGE